MTPVRVRSVEQAVLGRAVRELRGRFHLSQERVGLGGGLHRNYVGAIERGEINPTFAVLLKLADGLDGAAVGAVRALRTSARGGALRARGRLHTTTVRSDADTWAEVVAESDRLGIAHAEHIRGAVLRPIGGAGEHDRLLWLEVQCARLTERTQQIARSVVRMIRSLKAAHAVST